MKILLVYPKYPDTFWSYRHVLKFVKKKATTPPLGLLTIAPMLPEEWEKKLVDLNIQDLSEEDILWADIVFISAMIVQSDSVKGIVQMCKSFGRTIVAGGPCFTTTVDRFPGIDHFVLNEAEVTLPLFLADFEAGKALPVYRSDLRPDIKNTKAPMWSLLDMKAYVTMAVQFSRGCPFDCEFCDIVVMNGRVPRTKSSEQMIAEIQSLYNSGWRGPLFVVDDNFIGNKPQVKKFLAILIDWQKAHKYPFTLSTEASVNLADDPTLLQLMSSANFNSVFLGIETPDSKCLAECGKWNNAKRDLAEAVRVIHRHGMQVTGGFIVGFDHDTEAIFKTQIEFIQEIGVVTAMVGLLNVLPQTRLWHRLKSEGRLLKESTGENTDGTINFVPVMEKAKLIDGYKEIISTIYSPKAYYQRINTFLKNYKPTVRAKFSMKDISAFIRSCWHVGILSRSRFLYWKLVMKTSILRTKSLPAAVELAVCGQHFEKITQKVNSA